jgi:hypothetical protein
LKYTKRRATSSGDGKDIPLEAQRADVPQAVKLAIVGATLFSLPDARTGDRDAHSNERSG